LRSHGSSVVAGLALVFLILPASSLSLSSISLPLSEMARVFF